MAKHETVTMIALCSNIIYVLPLQNASLSLAERQALQRAQQLKFLKAQGLINNEKQVRGGAGAQSPKLENDGTSSVASFGSFLRSS